MGYSRRHSGSRQAERTKFDSDFLNDFDLLPPGARHLRYFKAALLRAQGVQWKEIAPQIGLSQGRCQNLTQESWWPELSAWAGRQAWSGEVLQAGVSRVLRCLRQLPPESREGLEYARLVLQANGLLQPPGLGQQPRAGVNVQAGILNKVQRLSDKELTQVLVRLGVAPDRQ